MFKIASRRRWGDNDRYFGPFTYAYQPKPGYRPISVLIESGEEEYPGAQFRLSAFGLTFISPLPNALIRPHREKVYPKSWDAATVERLGRNWYWQIDKRKFGFSYNKGLFSAYFGRSTMDSSTDRRWSRFLPWTQWRFVRHSFYGLNGQKVSTLPDIGKPYKGQSGLDRLSKEREIKDATPTVAFDFYDFDGERITATTKIEEREWKFGTGLFKWLSLFRKPKISRSLDIQFSAETGKRKGSWKGGTIGHSIEMLSGELHESAFKRYCAQHDMTFVGQSSPAVPQEGE